MLKDAISLSSNSSRRKLALALQPEGCNIDVFMRIQTAL
jgi:hypothetical protein